MSYDRRGFGRSDWSYTGHEYDTLAVDLHSLMEKLDLKNATLIGFSMGGGEVARYLSHYGSKRVKKAVLISAVTPYVLKTVDNPNGVEQKVFDNIIDNLIKDRSAFLKSFAEKFYGRSMIHHTVSEPFLEFFQSMALMSSPLATL